MRRVTESQPIFLDDVRMLARGRFGDMVKGVVDLAQGIPLLDADLHADQRLSCWLTGRSKPTSGGSTSIRT